MRRDSSWKARTSEADKMSSIQGLPAQGTETSVIITRVHIHPQCELVEFWAKFSEKGTADYLSLVKNIQSPGNLFKEFEGNPGDHCLAQKDGFWYRARIVSRNGPQHVVFLIDKGITYSTITTKLAWGSKEYFYLPPEVEFCVLANVLPVSPNNRWSPVALEFLKSLIGISVKAHVQEVLMLHRMFVLHISCIAQQMCEMGFARKLSTEMFKDFLFASLQCKSGPTLPSEPQSLASLGMGERLHKKEMFMYPELQAGTVETVVVTEVTNPHRIFCQLKVFSQELKKLSEQLTQCCDGRTAASTIGPEMIGCPCAARGSDGKWYRAVLQQVFPSSKVVEVLNVDYGIKQIVQVENVRALASEFFRMPVVTYNCSLHGIIDKGIGWTTAQIEYLRTLLLFKTIIAKFEYQSITEGVYYVTLYGDENSNINKLFGSKESCLLQCEKTLGDYAICTSGHSCNNTSAKQKRMGVTEENKKMLHSLPVEDLPVKSSYVAFVQYVSSPSEFWIQTQNFANELDGLMEKLANLYQNDLNDDVVKNPTVGLYCAAKAKDGEYYRAIVTQVGNTKVKVHFVDYGNGEAVENRFIKPLPDEFKKLPLLALKCTLANVRPKAGEWSQEACELFTKTVMDRALDVHVITKLDGCHFVQVTDPEAQGEKDLAKLLCATGFAERDEARRHSKVKTSSQFALSMTQYSGTAFHSQNNVTDGNEQKQATFKEQMFSIGSVLDVNVSFIESPNDFWCQLVQSAGHLKLLMYDMQTHYRNSEFQPLTETACVARHLENGLWYRALIIHKHNTPHVDVLFIDYGQTETVNILDLRKIEKEFLTLPGQAFRCSLFNPVDPTLAINDWTEEAVDRFHNFIETAAKNVMILKCTIYAVMYSEQKIMFNIVNLETPFESICTSLVNLVKSAPPAGPSFRLDTYYYSTHNVKTGTEEQVTVTSVKNVSHFYCQLRRNADVLKDLQLKVTILCEQLLTVKVPPVFGTLCFARYTDGHWYRGQIKASKPSILVHFVDYGDTIEVDKDDLLPIPKEASDIMGVPVQAVLCSLSDIPDSVPPEANSWFENSSIECDFRALIVAKEPNGKLVVELYQGKGQVNTKIKKLFEVEIQTEEPKARSGEPTVKPTSKESLEEAKHGNFVPKLQMTKQNEPVGKKMHPQPRSRQNVRGDLQLYRPPHQRESNGTCKYKESDHAKQNETQKYTELSKDRTLAFQTKPNNQDSKQHTPGRTTESWIDDSNVPPHKIEILPKVADLPSKSITRGMVTDVYISHSNSPLSFYVQLVKEENDIFSIVENLNDPTTSSESDTITELHPGDLVQAEFSDDSSWYRAAVKEKQDKATVLVEFVDFGNTASVPISKMRKLDKTFLTLPAYSTHCLLKSAAGLEKVLDPEVVSAFESAIGNVGEKQFKCEFIQQFETVWKVSLQDNGVEIECKPTSVKSQSDSTLSQVEELQFKAKATDFQAGQQLEVYISTISDAQSFWCQSATTGELEQIFESVAKAGDSLDPKDINSLSIGSPCIALFSEDQLWYRAEVLNRIGDEVSLLFVDYGNISQVKLGDVREIPPQLIKIPMQAFLCQLEGFDSSKGSWESSAADKLSALTVDQILQLTVCKVTKEDGKTKCYVHLECEGHVINESMREFWKSTGSEVLKESESSIETQPLSEPETVHFEEPKKEQSCEVSTTLEQSLSEVIEVLIKEETDTETGSMDFETSESLVEVDENPILADDTQVSLGNSGGSFVVPLEEDKNQMCSTSSGSQILESLDIDISAITIEPTHASTYDMAMEETLLYCTSDESEDLSSSFEARLMDQDLEEQYLSVLDTTGPEDMGSSLEEFFLEAMDESPSKEAGDDLDTYKFSDQNQNPDVPSVEACPPIAKRAARLVPCLSLTRTGKISPEQETPDEPSLGSLQLQNEDLFLVDSNYLLQDSFYQDMETSETVIPETAGYVSMTSARMVPRLSFNLTSNTSPEQESPDEFQENQDVLPSSVVSSQDPLDSDQDAQTPDVVVPQIFCSSETSDIMTEDFSFLPSSDILPQDSSDLVQDIETSEAAVPETHASEEIIHEPTNASVSAVQTCEDAILLPWRIALPDDSFDSDEERETPEIDMSQTAPYSVTSDTMNQELPFLPSSDVLPQDSSDLVQDIETSEAAVPETHASEEIIHEPTNASVSAVQTCEDAILLPWRIALPDDSFDSDQERETPEIDMSQTAPYSVTSDTMQNQELPFLPSSDVLPQDSIEQELGSKADDDVLCPTSKDETPDFRTKVSSEPLVYCEETFQDLFGATESQTCSVTPAEKGDGTKEAAHLTEISLFDLCTDEKSQIENLSETSSERCSVTEEEMMNKSPPSVEVPCGQLIVLDDVETGAESESCSFTSLSHFPEMAALTEQTSCVVEEACTSDLYTGEESAAEEESSESLEDSLKQMEESSDDTLTEKSFADDSLEAQLSKVTHLCLIVKDGFVLEHLPEE